MECTQIPDLMGSLKLYGMRGACDDVMAAGIKRQHETPRIVGNLPGSKLLPMPRMRGRRLDCRSLPGRKYRLRLRTSSARSGRQHSRDDQQLEVAKQARHTIQHRTGAS